MTEEKKTVLEVKNLSVWLKEDGKVIPAVKQVDLSVKKGGCTGIIGESGCGKSLTCQTVLGLLEPRKWKCQAQVFLDGVRVPVNDDRAMDAFRGGQIGLVSQNPMAAFDPRMTIGRHFCESHPRNKRKERLKEAEDALGRMYISNPESVLKSYSFQLSGGMLQRILIALTLNEHPRILILDEPTTALDSTTQAEILRILKERQEAEHHSLLLVTHDLEVISRMADTIYVMYAGMVVEYGAGDQVLKHPLHPYTRGLFQSRPEFSKNRLKVMQGRPPRLGEEIGTTCPFAPRCPHFCEDCEHRSQELRERETEHFSRCVEGMNENITGNTTTE